MDLNNVDGGSAAPLDDPSRGTVAQPQQQQQQQAPRLLHVVQQHQQQQQQQQSYKNQQGRI